MEVVTLLRTVIDAAKPEAAANTLQYCGFTSPPVGVLAEASALRHEWGTIGSQRE
jgi:hypothetical protein